MSAMLFGLAKVIVNCEDPPVEILVGENDTATVAAFGAVTVSTAFAAALLAPAGPVVSAPAAMAFVKEPAVALETDRVSVQLPLGGISPPASVKVFDATARL